MSRQFRFYATKEDLVSAFEHVDTAIRLKYADAWIHVSKDIPVFESLADWDGLGINTTGRTAGAGFFLIVRESVRLQIKPITMEDGTIEYKYGPAENPSSIVIQPSGVYCDPEKQELIPGMFGTAMNNEPSLLLYQEFKKKFAKQFRKRSDGSWIGEVAFRLINCGELSLVTG